MLRLLFVIPSLACGGAERHAVTLMCRLAQRGHECHAASIKNLDPSQSAELRVRLGDRVQCLDAARYLDPRALGSLVDQVKRLQPDAIVAANPYALMYASLGRRFARLNAQLVVTYHSTRILGAKEQLKMLFYRPFFWTADCLIFVSNKQKQYSQRRGVFACRNQVIHNGVDTERFRNHFSCLQRCEVRSAFGFSEQDYLIGIAAWLRPEKNHLQLVDAVAALRKRGIAACALMIGEGEMRAAIETRARTLGVRHAVAITGFQPEVRPYVAACDVMTLCSFSEAFSLAAIEAMALAKPVVHTDVGGAAEMIFPGENGFLFPVGDTPAFVDRLALLADRNVAEAMGQRARAIVQAQFSEEAMVDRYERTLVGLCRQRSGVGDSGGVPDTACR